MGPPEQERFWTRVAYDDDIGANRLKLLDQNDGDNRRIKPRREPFQERAHKASPAAARAA